jgi:hypothetical protein
MLDSIAHCRIFVAYYSIRSSYGAALWCCTFEENKATMSIFSNIKDFVSWKLIDKLFPRLLDLLQSMSPKAFGAIVIICGTVHVWATHALEQAQILCATQDLCLDSVERVSLQAAYWASLITGLMTGTTKLSAARDALQKPKDA